MGNVVYYTDMLHKTLGIITHHNKRLWWEEHPTIVMLSPDSIGLMAFTEVGNCTESAIVNDNP